MEKILILGAGRSSNSLISYLLDHAKERNWQLTIADYALQLAEDKARGHERAKAVALDITNDQERKGLVKEHDFVVSMLPAKFHPVVAEDCLQLEKHLFTASYVSPDMKAMDDQARSKGLLFLNECGLDPGIDHMSAMKVIDHIREEKGLELRAFESFTGGLLAPDPTDDNPWQYGFTWNPRNVVLAGQGTVKFIQEGRYKFIPYHKLFRRIEMIHIPGYGYFEGYANRDSLMYLDVYNLRGIKTLYRGTLRRPGFCKAWDVFVQLGATDDSYLMEGVEGMTHRQFINSFLSFNPKDSVELKLAHYLGLDLEGPEMHKLQWLGMFDEEPVGLMKGTPAQILEHILKKKWTIGPDKKDQIVMWHLFDYEEEGVTKRIRSAMVATGENARETAMSKTVGLPLAIAIRLFSEGKIESRGVQVPISKEFYAPILDELDSLGFQFIEEEVILD
ncbi:MULTISPECIES: saccharopine dehydrogenase family protein [Roseivirga]|uniref:Saccharopine dehydrogenase n=1 Tax=Roseivirga thermotolerans TaxID=1758176 RepID=A0ABQ3I7A1_9BACT|nr:MULTISPECIES: saccharopine dehydrogenase C-terminal domain-containing protein [Roseivirga]GHE61577.1 saccharopine dehydrogenase [Roseivirga thermotolerans]|tara:strand:- start:4268 stop:5611 length:1344 start_codon:yes stop_codon:yes gene_type:complete